MYGAVAPMLSVIVTDDELKQVVKDYIAMQVMLDAEFGTCQSWLSLVEHGDDKAIPIIERLRIAYNIEV